MTGQTKTALPYYDFSKLWSHNGYYNFILGARGTGKTYGAKVKAIKNALRKGQEFIYLRRHKAELIKAKNSFFADVAEEFPDHDFRVNGMVAEYAPASTRDEGKTRKWFLCGYFISLSTAGTQKSVAFPKVTLIIFDEFIIMKGAVHYLPNEANLFNEFYSTVDRYKAKTRVLFLANSTSIDNPYFIEWDITPEPDQEWIVAYDGFIVCHFHDSSVFAGAVYETPFGKFIKGTEYAEYSVSNQFADNDQMLIIDKTPTARYKWTIETPKGTFAIWYDAAPAEYYITKKRPGNELLYTIQPERMGEGKMLIEYNDRRLQVIRTSFKQGRVFFDEPQTRNAFRELFKRR